MEQQSQFEGWAILEIFGHQKYAGFVKTEYYGTACMFRCDVPPLEERQQVTRGGCYVETDADSRSWVPPGSIVKKSATQGYSKLFGVGLIYSMTPCDEKAALAAVEVAAAWSDAGEPAKGESNLSRFTCGRSTKGRVRLLRGRSRVRR